MSKTVSFIGIGKLGLCAMLLCDSKGYSCLGVDVNEGYLQSLRDKTFRTNEPCVNELLQDSRGINVSTKVSDALNFSDLIMCFVQTPSNQDDSYDHTYIEQVVSEIDKYIAEGNSVEGKTLSINCTVMPNYTKGLHDRLSVYDMNVVYNPTMIAQGSVVDNLSNPDIIFIGGDAPDSLFELYETISPKSEIEILSHTGAELVKIGTNCFLSFKIAFANMIGDLCIKNGLSEFATDRVLDTIGSDSRVGGKYLKYGLPASGVCLPRDVRALDYALKNKKVDRNMLWGLYQFNEYHMEFLLYQIQKKYSLNDTIEITQLSYKPNVPIITESRQLELCIMILKEGYKVNIKETKSVIEQVKPILKDFENQITYTEI